jgi:hypothetical protein
MKTNLYQSMSDDELFYSLVDRYAAGEIPAEVTSRFDALLQRPDYKDKVDLFKKAHGKLQLLMEGFYLNEEQTMEIRSFAQGASNMTEEEQQGMDDMENSSRISGALRFCAFFVILCGIIGGSIWKFAPEKRVKFDALYYLSYESTALQNDPAGRMDLITEDSSELDNYFLKYPNLGIKVKALSLPAEWAIKGATVIDYDIAKVAAVQYALRDGSDSLIQFVWASKKDDLPAAYEAKEGPLTYSSYTSDSSNLISYSNGDGTSTLLVGRLSAVQMAKMAAVQP